jgi:hypothetical protein
VGGRDHAHAFKPLNPRGRKDRGYPTGLQFCEFSLREFIRHAEWILNCKIVIQIAGDYEKNNAVIVS